MVLLQYVYVYNPTVVHTGVYKGSPCTYFKWVILNIRNDITEYVEQI